MQQTDYFHEIREHREALKIASQERTKIQKRFDLNRTERDHLSHSLSVESNRMTYARRGIFINLILMAGLDPKDHVFGLEDMNFSRPSNDPLPAETEALPPSLLWK